MRSVFADSGYFIARLNRREELHERAVTVAESLAPFRMVTTQMVLVETLNGVAREGEHLRRLATELVHELQNDPYTEIVPQTAIQFGTAFERYENRPDQKWSLTDCASFLLMEERKIWEALAHDRDFEQAGFVALLRENATWLQE